MPVGEAACLGAAFLWAFAVAIFRSAIETHGARAVNLVKCLLATVLLGVTTVLAGSVGDLAAAPRRTLVLVALSGVVGLTFGDTALFGAVARIGPYRTLLLQTLAPVFAAAVDAAFRHVVPRGADALGSAIILAGVLLVVSAPRRAAVGPVPPPRAPLRGVAGAGVAFGVLAALGQGAGVVLAKAGTENLSFLPAAFLRLAAAALGLVLVGAAGGRLRTAARVVAPGGAPGRVVAATLLGTYLAMMLMMAGIEYSPAAVAAVLLATTPVFSLFLDAWLLRERITARALSGTVLAILGVVAISR